MAEGKKREYLRATCEKKIVEFVERASLVNAGKADYRYYNRVEEIILFGSMANTENDKVHDIDLYVQWTDDRILMAMFMEENEDVVYQKFPSFIDAFFAEWHLAERFLKGRCGIFSVHSNVVEGKGVRRIACADKHLYLMRNGIVNEEALARFRKSPAK